MRIMVPVTVLLMALATLPAHAVYPGPNGEIVVSTGDGVLAVTPDGVVRTIDPEYTPKVAVHPDGRTMLRQTRDNGILLQSLAGGPRHTIIADSQIGGKPDFSWSPDGSQFVLYGFDGQRYGTSILNADGSGAAPLAGDLDLDDALVWSTDGRIYGLSGQIAYDPRDGSSQAFRPEGYSPLTSDRGIDSSPDGTQLLFSCFEGQVPGLCVTDTSYGLIRFIAPPAGTIRAEYAAFSPDGARIAFSATADVTFEKNLWIAAADGSGATMLAAGVDIVRTPEWAIAPGTPPAPLEEPPPPATNAPLACGGFDGDPTTTERADFSDPVLFAVAVSQARFGCEGSDPAGHVVLSRDDAFADSLVGAALTGNGPLLFTDSTALPAATATEVDRVLDPGDVIYLLGGTVAVSEAIEQQLAATYTVRRLAGPSRVETSVAVALEVLALGGDPNTVAVARAGGPADNPTAGWADSVSAGAYTARFAVPTVVTDTASVHPAVAAFLSDTDPSATILLGGTAALSTAVEDAVPGPLRVAGATRAGTAQAIQQEYVGIQDDNRLVVINGFREDGWLFGLPAAGLAADGIAAIALATNPVPPETLQMACDPAEVDLLLAGGLGALSADIASALESAPAC